MTAIPAMLSCQQLKSSPNGHRGIETISHGKTVSAGVIHHFLFCVFGSDMVDWATLLHGRLTWGKKLCLMRKRQVKIHFYSTGDLHTQHQVETISTISQSNVLSLDQLCYQIAHTGTSISCPISFTAFGVLYKICISPYFLSLFFYLIFQPTGEELFYLLTFLLDTLYLEGCSGRSFNSVHL